MEINSPEFNEKQFLLGVLKVLQEKFEGEQRFILEYKFSAIDTSIAEYIPTLNKLAGENSIKKYILYWFKEAEVRGLVELSGNFDFKITRAGFNEALRRKSPVKYFCKAHWKFILTISLSFLGAIVAIIRLTKC